MKITGIEVIPFETFPDRFSNGEPYPKQKVLQTLTKVATAEGVDGYFFGGHFHGDQEGLLATDQALITQLIGPCSPVRIQWRGRRSGSGCWRPRSPRTS